MGVSERDAMCFQAGRSYREQSWSAVLELVGKPVDGTHAREKWVMNSAL